jgi:hypothetical protein
VSLKTKVAKATRLLSERGARWLRMSPRIPYIHYWTLRDGAESLVCIHNFFSVLSPDARQSCPVYIRFYDAYGQHLTSTSLGIEFMGSRMVDVRGVLGRLVGAPGSSFEGSLEVDMAPPRDFAPTGEKVVALRPSSAYFYMIYRSTSGMLTTVHCIERGSTLRGVPAPMGRLLGMRTRDPVGSWRSKRAICADNLREIRAVAINHAGGPRRLHLALRRGAEGSIVTELEGTIPPRGLLILEYQAGDGSRGSDDYLLCSEALATPNAKPYVWVRYGTSPMTVHHG